jgi:hypothetical protein
MGYRGRSTFCGPESYKIFGAVLRKKEYKNRYGSEYFFFSLLFHWLYIPGWDLTLSLNFVLETFLPRGGGGGRLSPPLPPPVGRPSFSFFFCLLFGVVGGGGGGGGGELRPHAQPPSWRPRLSLFVWDINCPAWESLPLATPLLE